MAKFYLKLSNGKQAEMSIAENSAHEAINVALNALAKFACQHFPPPPRISITVSDEKHTTIATLRLAFDIEYASNWLSKEL